MMDATILLDFVSIEKQELEMGKTIKVGLFDYEVQLQMILSTQGAYTMDKVKNFSMIGKKMIELEFSMILKKNQ